MQSLVTFGMIQRSKYIHFYAEHKKCRPLLLGGASLYHMSHLNVSHPKSMKLSCSWSCISSVLPVRFRICHIPSVNQFYEMAVDAMEVIKSQSWPIYWSWGASNLSAKPWKRTAAEHRLNSRMLLVDTSCTCAMDLREANWRPTYLTRREWA